jgi:predicted RecB family nuclease
MFISDKKFQAFLNCEMKFYLSCKRGCNCKHDFSNWHESIINDYKQSCFEYLSSKYCKREFKTGKIFPQVFDAPYILFVSNSLVITENIKTYIHAIEKNTSPKPKKISYTPLRFVLDEKITREDKLLLAFDALALSEVSGIASHFGKIIHGSMYKTMNVKVEVLIKDVREILGKIITLINSGSSPELALNKHCPKCLFEKHCFKIAKEKDDLLLLPRMTPKERVKLHHKGIFTVTQLSFTFRPRKRHKNMNGDKKKYYHSLKALAIREGKIYIAGNNEFEMKGTPVYLDVEGIPESGFYYLIGIRIKAGASYIQKSFWANGFLDEKKIWSDFVDYLKTIENPQLIHYGRYETHFLKKMKDRYIKNDNNKNFIEVFTTSSLNILNHIYANVYFPTYSNGLKEIANYLGFQWSDLSISGLKSIIWRHQWENARSLNIKQKLIRYNSDDCSALQCVTDAVLHLYQNKPIKLSKCESEIIYTETLKRKSPYHLGRNTFSMPEFQHINKAAYWDYQRDRIYVKSSKRLKYVARKKVKRESSIFLFNKTVKCPGLNKCPNCKSSKIRNHSPQSRIIYDLRFSRFGVKRWIIKYCYQRYICNKCGVTFNSFKSKSKYAKNLLSYIVYQNIELRIPQETVVKSLNKLFGLNLPITTAHFLKSKAACDYVKTFQDILSKITSGKLIHVDETKISVQGNSETVWVMTTLEEVVYMHTKTRDGDMLKELLRDYKGVMVSDFHPIYDSINCSQQKCLIHLIRDLHDDLFKEPFDQNLEELTRNFAVLVKAMIETVDRAGLKTYFLKKHKTSVERFYKQLTSKKYTTETAIRYKKRFLKNRDKLFTFLDYDGVPWNNNNAEHAIKAFATLRRVISGPTTSKGINEYLILLSICETCKYKGVSFLDFLRSGVENIDIFVRQKDKLSLYKIQTHE